MLLMIDNYDSFTFNLVQYFGELGQDVRVLRNDEIDVAGIAALQPARLVLSPGPCTPAEAGVCVAAIQHFAGKLPILGVCLGHQAIGAALGGNVVRARAQMHGKASTITADGLGVFRGIGLKKVTQHRVAVLRQDRLGVELHALDGQRLVPHAHDLAVVSGRSDPQVRRQ